jgi:hypothetical protein
MFYVKPDTLLKVSLNTNKTGHNVQKEIDIYTEVLGIVKYARYNVEHCDQFYWCLTTLSTICQVLRITW